MWILITHTGSAHMRSSALSRLKIAAYGLIVSTSMMALSTTASASDRDDARTLGASGVKAQVGVVYSRGGGGKGTGGRHR